MKTRLTIVLFLFLTSGHWSNAQEIVVPEKAALTVSDQYAPSFVDGQLLTFVKRPRMSNKEFFIHQKDIATGHKSKTIRLNASYGKALASSYIDFDSSILFLFENDSKKNFSLYAIKVSKYTLEPEFEGKLFSYSKSYPAKKNVDYKISISEQKSLFSVGLIEFQANDKHVGLIKKVNAYSFDKNCSEMNNYTKDISETFNLDMREILTYDFNNEAELYSNTDVRIQTYWDVAISDNGLIGFFISGKSQYDDRNNFSIIQFGGTQVKEKNYINQNSFLSDTRLFFADEKLNAVLLTASIINWISIVDSEFSQLEIPTERLGNVIVGFEMVENDLILLTQQLVSHSKTFKVRDIMKTTSDQRHSTINLLVVDYNSIFVYRINPIQKLVWENSMTSEFLDNRVPSYEKRGVSTKGCISNNELHVFYSRDNSSFYTSLDLASGSVSNNETPLREGLRILSSPPLFQSCSRDELSLVSNFSLCLSNGVGRNKSNLVFLADCAF